MTTEERNLLVAVARLLSRMAIGEQFYNQIYTAASGSSFTGPVHDLNQALDALQNAEVDRKLDTASSVANRGWQCPTCASEVPLMMPQCGRCYTARPPS